MKLCVCLVRLFFILSYFWKIELSQNNTSTATNTKPKFHSIANYIHSRLKAHQLVMYLSNNTTCILITRTYTFCNMLLCHESGREKQMRRTDKRQ